MNGIIVIAREKDGYINLTQLCKAGNKKFNDWFRSKKTKACLQVLSSETEISVSELLKYQTGSGSNQATWGHPDLAIHLAQWISPEFAMKVSKWTRELLLTGSVILGKEKSYKELDREFKKRIKVIDIRPYDKEDVVYFLTFSPCENLNTGERKCYKFGVTSNISKRLIYHENDKKFNDVLISKIFKCKSRNETSELEKHVKRVLKNMKLYVEYGSKKECFMATEEELESIYEEVEEFLENNEEEQSTDNTLSLTSSSSFSTSSIIQTVEPEKFNKEKTIYELFRDGRINFDQFKEIQKNEREMRKFDSFKELTSLFKDDKISMEDMKEMLNMISS